MFVRYIQCFSIDAFIQIITRLYNNCSSPILDLIAKRGFSPFEILISTVLSLRTKDQITSAACDRLFKLTNKPEIMSKLSLNKIQQAIYPVGFYRRKSDQIIRISRVILDMYDGSVPRDMETLLTLPGVGRKTANLVLSEGFNIPSICVDVHVHRISNRIGYIQTKEPYETEVVLRNKLPKKYWRQYNKLLVAFGQSICRPISPFCNKCPVSFMCIRFEVKKFR